MIGKRLQTWVGKASEGQGVFFRPANVAYAPPNPDNTRQECGNCVHRRLPDRCHLHEPEQEVQDDMVCSHHIFGEPSEAPVNSTEGIAYLRPEYSGLCAPPAPGASCDRCIMYKSLGQESGLCLALRDPEQPDSPFSVDALARCARFAPLDNG